MFKVITFSIVIPDDHAYCCYEYVWYLYNIVKRMLNKAFLRRLSVKIKFPEIINFTLKDADALNVSYADMNKLRKLSMRKIQYANTKYNLLNMRILCENLNIKATELC
jgi:hypothetical protein